MRLFKTILSWIITILLVVFWPFTLIIWALDEDFIENLQKDLD